MSAITPSGSMASPWPGEHAPAAKAPSRPLGDPIARRAASRSSVDGATGSSSASSRSAFLSSRLRAQSDSDPGALGRTDPLGLAPRPASVARAVPPPLYPYRTLYGQHASEARAAEESGLMSHYVRPAAWAHCGLFARVLPESALHRCHSLLIRFLWGPPPSHGVAARLPWLSRHGS